MNVKDFVKRTLLEITDGVAEAQSKSQLFIAPGMIDGQPAGGAQFVKFEISVAVNKEGNGELSLLSFGSIGADVTRSDTQKISFEVPVYFELQTKNHPIGKAHFDVTSGE
ncbi:MAG: hypothetical protein AAGA38_18305 [Pseudomonadota bacterium]